MWVWPEKKEKKGKEKKGGFGPFLLPVRKKRSAKGQTANSKMPAKCNAKPGHLPQEFQAIPGEFRADSCRTNAELGREFCTAIGKVAKHFVRAGRLNSEQQ